MPDRDDPQTRDAVPAGEREYMVRIKRHPLTKEQIEAFRSRGVLAPDYKDRSVTISDFERVTAPNDSVAASRVMEKTILTFRGERAELHEALPGAEFRPMGFDSPQWKERRTSSIDSEQQQEEAQSRLGGG